MGTGKVNTLKAKTCRKLIKTTQKIRKLNKRKTSKK